MATVQKKTVLITGCSTGSIGWALTKVFREQGYYVFATVRDHAKAKDLAELSDDIEVLEVDVTVPDTIIRAHEIVSKRTGGKLDILINNAGTEFVCPLLDTDIAAGKELYETTVWGPLAMVQAFAPMLIAAKGTIANHSSIAAVLPMVWTGVYASAKAAQSRMSEIMRVEMAPLGVRVITVMLGSVNTPIFNKPGGQMKLSETSYYYGIEEQARKQRTAHQGESMRVEPFAQDLFKYIVSGTKGPIWLGTFAPLVRLGHWAFPQWYMDKASNVDRGLDLIPSS